MKIDIKATNTRLTKSLQEYIDKKIGRLKKFLTGYQTDEVIAFVEIGRPSQRHKTGRVYYAEVNLRVAGRLYRVKNEATDLYAAIDEVKDELQREIRRNKEKKITKERRKARSLKKSRSISPYARFRKKQ